MAAIATKAATISMMIPLLLNIALLAFKSMKTHFIKLVLVNIIKGYGIRNSIAIYLYYGYIKNSLLNNLLQRLLRIF